MWAVSVDQLARSWVTGISSCRLIAYGHDIFAPTGAHLAAGVPLSELGTPSTDPIRLDMPCPERTENGWRAHITIIDTFGNLATDLPAGALEGNSNVLIRIRDHEVDGIIEFYGQREPGDLIALVDSEDFIEIAVVNGSAAQLLGAQVGDVVEVIYRD